MPDDIGFIIVFIVCVILNIINSAVVTAFTDCDDNILEEKAEAGKKSAKRALKLLNNSKRFLTTTDFVGIFAFFGMGYYLIHTAIYVLPKHMPVWAVCLVLVVILMFIEILTIKVPKRVAGKYANSLICAHSGLMVFMTWIFTPLACVCESIARVFLLMFRIKPGDNADVVTEEEIISSVEEAQESGVLEEDEAEMINKIFSFDDKQVSEIMTHRMNVIALRADTPFREALQNILDHSFSRYPVFEESIENIIGIVHIKDLMGFMLEHDHEELDGKTIRDFVREAYFVPDTQNINDLFHELQQKKCQLAIAIDEYGQTAGIVTMEDILEEIVGEIQDEYDEEEEDVMVKKADVLIVNGLITLSELSEELDDEIESEDFDTLNGLLISLLDHIPAEDERGEFEYQGYRFRILEVANHTISKVKVTKIEAVKPDNN